MTQGEGVFMASAKREQEYEANRRRYKEAQSGFKFGVISGMAVTGAVLVGLTLYYIFMALASVVGWTMAFGQMIVDNEMGNETDTVGLGYVVYYGTWAYLAVTTALPFAAYALKKRGINKFLLILFAAGALYGLLGMFLGWCGTLRGLYLLISGVYETWLQSYILRLHKEMDFLALQEGFPDFIPALAEPKTMANTVGLTSKKSEFIMRQRKEQKEKGEASPAPLPESLEMDELSLDTPLPKSNRKIDSMM